MDSVSQGGGFLAGAGKLTEYCPEWIMMEMDANGSKWQVRAIPQNLARDIP